MLVMLQDKAPEIKKFVGSFVRANILIRFIDAF
jgi:hypothetical protein